MMDVNTVTGFQHLCSPGKPATYEEIELLPSDERAVYESVKSRNRLLEQEKLPHDYVSTLLRALQSNT